MSTIGNNKQPVEFMAGGVIFLIDADDFERVSKHKWSLNDNKRGHRYAQTAIKRDGVWNRTRLHRFLLDAQGGVVDHINGDTTDNRRANLRLSDYSTNSINRKRTNGGPHKTGNGWIVRLMVSGVSTYHGFFLSLEEAQAKFNQVVGESYAR